jgi:tetratricopeptide (TPR) repeat protein
VHLLEEIAASGHAFADAHHLLGVSLSLLGMTERALAEFDRALALNPRYLEALIHRGLVLNELGRSAEAEESFRRAALADTGSIGGFPAPVAAQLANRHADLAQAYAEVGSLPDAIEQYRRALEPGTTFHYFRYRLARVLLEENALPDDVDPLAADLTQADERARIAQLLRAGIDKPTGYVLPLQAVEDAATPTWETGPWPLRRGRLYAVGGDSPLGLRLPLGTLSDDAIRTALVAQVRNGHLHVFVPPVEAHDSYAGLIGAI